MHRTVTWSRVGLLCAASILAACSEPTGPGKSDVSPKGLNPLSKTSAVAECRVDVKAATLTCADVRLPAHAAGALRSNFMLGSQDVFVRLTSTGTAWDAGTEILSSDVVVQNLIQQMIGTSDGATVDGVTVFFHNAPAVTSGTGTVTLANADGTSAFTGGGQPYYLYNEILQPYQISVGRQWQFNVPPTVGSFVFQVLLTTTAPNEALPFLDKVWTGSAGTAWSNASNWNSGVPDSANTVAIPPETFIASGNMPVISENRALTNLRVGTGSTLDLGSFTLRIWGNLDSPGTMSNGVAWLRGASAIVGGNVPSLIIDGSARVQRAIKATGAVSITGSLTVKDQTLTIALP